MCGDNRSVDPNCTGPFSQVVRVFDLTVSSAPTVGAENGRIRIPAKSFDTYAAAFTAEATVDIRVGTVSADPYNLYRVPVRRGSRAFGEVFLSWDAQSGGGTLTLILGEGEEVGVR